MIRRYQLRAEPGQISNPLTLLIAIVATAFAYRPGVGGSLHFDDPHNLGGLARISDLSSALDFVLTGEAGPLGRPLALASFAVQFYAWPDSIDVMLYTNICIHLLNGVLVTWMLLLLGRERGESSDRAAHLATMSGALWMLLPLLASSSLLVVQRMTTLSATFVLAGIIGYLYGRTLLEKRPRVAVLLMMLTLLVATCLAAFTKENGVLLPVFVLVAEATLLAPPSGERARRWRAFLISVLALPAIGIVAYLVARFEYGDAVLASRNFTGADRLVTEAYILWEYLFHAFLPAVSNLGPFHDGHVVHRAAELEPSSIVAVGAWCVVIAAAIAARKRLPVLSFAIGWYIVGHSIESTTVPLELYFEHRNYVPIIGPVFAVVAAVDYEARKVPILRPAMFVYAAALCAVLFSMTSLWGRPLLAARMWSLYHPESVRAVQYLSQQYALMGYHASAHGVLEVRFAQKPDEISTALQLLARSCLLDPQGDRTALLEVSRRGLEENGYARGVTRTLAGLFLIAKDGRCAGLALDDVRGLVAAAEGNPRYRAVPGARHDLNLLLAEHAITRRDAESAMGHLNAALSSRYSIEALTRAVQVLVGVERRSAAVALLAEARQRQPGNPLRARVWKQRLERLAAYVERDVR